MVESPGDLARDLARAAAVVGPVVTAVVQASTTKVRVEGRRNSEVSSGRSAAGAPSQISSDVTRRGPLIWGQAGYERRGQGLLGNILEYGSVNNPPHRDLGRAMDREEPSFYASIAASVARLL